MRLIPRARRTLVTLALPVTVLLLDGAAREARAIPSFARQTGLACKACHFGGFHPELTPFGRVFKAHGYTFSNSKSRDVYQSITEGSATGFLKHLSGMLIVDYTRTAGGVPGDTVENQRTQWYLSTGNDSLAVPSQASAFYGGKVVGPLGAFIQGTYDGVGNAWVWDNTDIRAAYDTTLAGEPLLLGLSLNNGPTVQDLWNTTPAWGFPVIASGTAPAPAAATFVSGLPGQVVGVGPYVMWGNMIYAEAVPYLSGRNGPLTWLNSFGATVDQVVDGAAPYWRVVAFHDIGPHSISVGHYGMYTSAYGSGSTGPKNKYLDLAADLQYQYIGGLHAFSVKTSVAFEQQTNSAAVLSGDATNLHDGLNTFNLFLSYYYDQVIGTTVGYFDVAGSTDAGLYAPAAVSGSRTANPQSNGGIFEIDFQPFAWQYDPAASYSAVTMTRIALQYTVYGRFNGSSSNYDGSGRSASDNDTLYLALWVPF